MGNTLENLIATADNIKEAVKLAVEGIWEASVKGFEDFTGYTEFQEAGDQFVRQNNWNKDQANAYMHAYVSAELTVTWKVGVANNLGWGREFGSLFTRDLWDVIQNRDVSAFVRSQLDSNGDIYNNQIGLVVGMLVNSGIITREQIPEIIKGALDTGQLIIDKNNDPRVNLFGYQTPDFDLGLAIVSANSINLIHHCFPAGTKIRLADGSEKAIEHISTNDKVASFHPEHFAGKSGLEGQRVVRLFENITDIKRKQRLNLVKRKRAA